LVSLHPFSIFLEKDSLFPVLKQICFIFVIKLAPFETLQNLQNFVKVLEPLKLNSCITKEFTKKEWRFESNNNSHELFKWILN
jgi:hypothetical protein